MKSYLVFAVSALLVIMGITESTAQADDMKSLLTGTTPNLSQYLVDISATQVSAGGLVGLTNSAITEIQSSQDLVLAVNPFSSGSSKNGYGIALSPFRTNILPMSGKSYNDNHWKRWLGASTLSYAENTTSISGVSYREWAASVDTTYYLHKSDDPIIKAAREFPACTGRKEAEKALDNFYNGHPDMTKDENKTKEQELIKAIPDEWDKCVKSAQSQAKTAQWNASKFSVSAGYGKIRPDTTAGPSASLGETVTGGGIFNLGKEGAVYVTIKKTWHEVDLTTLSGTPTYKDSFLAAIRFTYGSENGGNMRWLAEGSTASTSKGTASNDVFKYALGLDMKVLSGVWLQFRVGRSRTADNTMNQTTSLLSLNWAPSSTLFGNK
jgi:hypothetical protein